MNGNDASKVKLLLHLSKHGRTRSSATAHIVNTTATEVDVQECLSLGVDTRKYKVPARSVHIAQLLSFFELPHVVCICQVLCCFGNMPFASYNFYLLVTVLGYNQRLTAANPHISGVDV